MKKQILILGALALVSVQGFAASISNVEVSFLKGYQAVIEDEVEARYYMGQVSYVLKGESSDSIDLDVAITPQGSSDAIELVEKQGDFGIVKNRNASDTAKTIYFRCRIEGEPASQYVAKITANAETSKMWALADEILGLMSVDEKEKQLYGSTNGQEYFWKGFGSDKLTLANGGKVLVGWRATDGPHGVRWPIGSPSGIAIYGAGDKVTLFPTEAALGCSFDTSLVRRVGTAIARECRAYGLYCSLGPMCDLVINPRWGRAFETMGEDPYANGKLATYQAIGLQNERVIATPKHFAPYVKETERYTHRVIVSERALRELFCEPFRMVIEEADARAIMTCYNKVAVPGFTTSSAEEVSNGFEQASTNRHLIETILRRDWGYDGVIMTDWDGPKPIKKFGYFYQTDQDMDMPEGRFYQSISDNLEWAGVSHLNKKARRVIYAKLWASSGKWIQDISEFNTHPKSVILSKEHLDISLEAARKTIVLAKNANVDGTPVLPLDKNGTFKIAVVGSYADVERAGGGGSSAVTPDSIITVWKGISNLVRGRNVTVTNNLDGADVAVVCVGVDKESEDGDRISMLLPSADLAKVTEAMGKVKKTIVVYTGGSASAAGSWSEAPGVLVAFYPGRFQGQAIAEIIFGEVNPSGHLCVTFPRTINDLPSFELVNQEIKLTSADTAHGYFFYEKKKIKPLFWFGHGLSYTKFNYTNITAIGSASITKGDRVDILVNVKNTGSRSGEDVVQLYVKPVNSSIPRRVKDLRGFSRVSLNAGETETVKFTLGPRDFSTYVVDETNKTGKWVVQPGQYEIIAGSTSDPEMLVDGNGYCKMMSLTVN